MLWILVLRKWWRAAGMQSIKRGKSPHRWVAGSEPYPGPCSWRPSRAGAATGSLQEPEVEPRRSFDSFSWKRQKMRNKIFKMHFAYMIYSTFYCNETWITGIISLWIKDSSSHTCVCRRTNCLSLFHENSAQSPLPPLCESNRHWSLKTSRERGKCAAVMDQIEKAAIVLASLQRWARPDMSVLY